MTLIFRTSLLLSLFIFSKVASSEQSDNKTQNRLTVSPKQCTTLKQGDTCYLDLEVTWRTSTEKSTCLFANANKLLCWHNKKQGELKQQITMQNDLVITLQTENKQVLHTQTIRYAWVHKKNNSKAMRWRMF